MHEDKALVQTVAHEIRARIQENLLGHARPSASRSGSDERPHGLATAILVTGLSTYWGGRLAQALEAFPEVEAIIGVDNEEPDASSSSAPST